MSNFQTNRRAWIGAAVAVTLTGITLCAEAQIYPVKPIEMIVPYPPGASVDLIARILQPKLTALLNQPIVIDNKGGAGGNIGAAYVAKSPADGYRLLLATNAIMSINPHISTNGNFDALKDLAPVARIANGPMGIAVRSDMPVNNLAELVALAKKEPGKLSYGSPGNGSPHHIIGELLKQRAGIFMVHVPYRGIGQALTDLLGGNINVVISTLAGLKPMASAGKIKVLAITEGKRFEGAPNIPTVAESYAGFEASSWFGVYAPAGTPADVVNRLNAAVNAALASDDVKAKFLANDLSIAPGTPEELGNLTRTDFARWGKFVREKNIHAN